MAAPYQQSIVAFLDILGFEDKIRTSLTKPEITQTIIKTLKQARHQALDLRNPQTQESINMRGVQVSQFSDSIVLSYPQISDDSFKGITALVMYSQADMATRGFFLRGAIVGGAHYHNRDLLFGPALVDAYQLSKLADWARVIIHPSLLTQISPPLLKILRHTYLREDPMSALQYLDYLRSSCVSAISTFLKHGPISPQPLSTLFSMHKKAILAAINYAKDTTNLSVVAKYFSLVTYHNWALDDILSLIPDVTTYKKLDSNTQSGRFYRHMYELLYSQGLPNQDITTRMNKWLELMHRDKGNLESCRIEWASPRPWVASQVKPSPSS